MIWLAAAALAALLPAAQTAPAAPAAAPRLDKVERLTTEGDGGEPYFSHDGRKIIFQSKRGGGTYDQIYIMNADGSDQHLVSTGKGRTTCSYFLPGDQTFLYAFAYADDAALPEAVVIYPASQAIPVEAALQVRDRRGRPLGRIRALGVHAPTLLTEARSGQPGPITARVADRIEEFLASSVAALAGG